LLGIFRVAMEEQRFSALGTDTSLGRQYGELVHDRQMGVIPSLRTGVVRLLASFPLTSQGVVLGIVQVMGAITSSRGLRAFPEEIRFELAFFPFELFDLLLQLGDPSQGIAMATLPISGLPAEFEVLSFETLDFGAEVNDFLAQSRHQANQLQGGVAGAPDLYQLAIHDQPGLPKMDKRERGESPRLFGSAFAIFWRISRRTSARPHARHPDRSPDRRPVASPLATYSLRSIERHGRARRPTCGRPRRGVIAFSE
jgi:hypothetical protein